MDRWRNNEIARISKLHTKGPKVAEFCLLLDKEIQLLRSIEKFRIELKENFKRKMEIRLLDHLSKPVVWKNSKGKSISMDTLETQQTRQLKELYFSFCQDDMKIDERMELLVNAKYKLDGLQTPLAKELVSLIDRETDLILRNLPSKDLDILRKRIQTTLFELIKSPEIAGSRLKKYQMDQMKDARLYRCHQCNQVKVYTQFPLESRTRQTNICTTCSWSNSTDPTWVDMSPYKRILQAVRREERKRKCWTSMAFVLQEKDIYFLVEKIWHARSVLSEISNIQDLKLCRWNANEEWSPWNCVALTTKEMKNHLKITNLEETYEIGLIDRVRHCHLLAKSYFKQSTNTKNDKDNDISSCSSAE